MKDRVLKLKSVNSKMSRSQSFHGSLIMMIPITTVCIVIFAERQDPDIADKTEFVTGKQFKRESLVYH